MQQSLTEHSLYVEHIRALWRYYELHDPSRVAEGLEVKEVYTLWFDKLTLGDLCEFHDLTSGQKIIGLLTDIRIVITSGQNYVHMWSSVMVGEAEYVFHTRVDRELYNDSLLYTKTHALNVDVVTVINSIDNTQV